MKKMQNPLAVLVISLILTVPAFAGNMMMGVNDPPPPPAPSESSTLATQDQSDTSSPVDPVAELARALINSILSVI